MMSDAIIVRHLSGPPQTDSLLTGGAALEAVKTLSFLDYVCIIDPPRSRRVAAVPTHRMPR